MAVYGTVVVHVHYIPYFVFNNPIKTPPILFSRKLRAAKQNEKGILVNSPMKTQYFAGLSLLCLSCTVQQDLKHFQPHEIFKFSNFRQNFTPK